MMEPGGKIIVQVDSDLQHLVPRFMENQRKALQTMREALGRGELDPIEDMGHSMKGYGGGYGFEGLTEIGGALETAAKTGDREEIARWLEELGTYLSRVEVIIMEGE